MMNRDPLLTRHVFQVQSTTAQHVSLVIGAVGDVARIFHLRPCGEGMWRTAVRLGPGAYRYCYHAFDGRALMYVAPPGAPLDGLKAVLLVEPANANHAGQFTQPSSVDR